MELGDNPMLDLALRISSACLWSPKRLNISGILGIGQPIPSDAAFRALKSTQNLHPTTMCTASGITPSVCSVGGAKE